MVDFLGVGCLTPSPLENVLRIPTRGGEWLQLNEDSGPPKVLIRLWVKRFNWVSYIMLFQHMREFEQ